MKKIVLSLLVIAASGAYVWDQSGRQPADDLLGSATPTGNMGAGVSPTRVQALAAAQPAVVRQPAPLMVRQAVASPATDVPATDVSLAAADPGKPLAPTASTAMSAAEAPPLPTTADAAAVVADAASQSAPQISSPIDLPMPRLRPTRHATQAKATPLALTVAANTSGNADGTYTGPATDAYYGLIQIQAIVQGGRLVEIKVLQYPSDRRTSVAINRRALPMLRDEVVTAQSANVEIISGATLTSEAFIQSLGGALRQATS